ncbi:GPI ethanolamine phosphate transferase 3 [Condylostylus longicornis]|uniref:GPI ethanolamine phosphate transferase 3 n=1 Tax=Condylostylus longicornis TaxID=2530218 RepID=UPI00244E119C|nr:GPI ethanolamine phosphate transferase 3 [Condylostylus longicornis]
MKIVWKYIFILIWFAYLICSGVILFSRGFLLSRISKKDVSTCRHLSTNANEEYYLNQEIVKEIFKDVNASSSLCLPKKSKVIILVIDALKYEFGLYQPNLEKPLPYQNKLTIFEELLTKEPDQTRLLKFLADPPTTTLQRLKGMTTGSLPTFVDIGSNFATPEINEDNIIDQVTRSGLSAVFLGDSTWTDLYPKRFKRHYSYPSFDIFDLDTVDRKIEKYLPKELNQGDWDLLIAHFLGVDHCGHRYGPLHPEMSRKLTEADNIIRKTIEIMDNETTLFVIGDHGMTKTGDHGGESIDEIEALLFAYSKSHKFITSDFGSSNSSMRQIDVVPTLATILGVPIPYSNLGLINFNLVPDIKTPYMLKYQTLLLHAWQNAKQIYNYFTQYAVENAHTFQFDDMDDVQNKFLVLTHRVNTIYSETAYKNFIKDLNQHLREILSTCRNIWVKFDANQMSQGLLLTFLPIFFAFLLINNLKVFQIARVFNTKTILYIYLFNFAAGVFAYRYFKDLQMKTELHSIIFFSGIVSTFFLSLLTVHNWPQIATNWSHVKRFVNFPTRIIFLISTSIYFSNSFIIQEAKILSYMLICLLLILMYDLIRESNRFDGALNYLANNVSSNKVPKFKLKVFFKSVIFKLIILGIFAITLIRFSWTLFKCREEHGNCDESTVSPNTSNLYNKYNLKIKTYLVSIVTLLLYTTLTRIYLKSCGNLTGFSLNVLLARYGPSVAAICTSGHILLSNSPVKTVKMYHIDGMAWVVYFLLVLQILILCISPLMTHVLPPRQNSIAINPYSSIVPEIFKKMKKIYEGECEQKNNEIPVVFGLATVYSSILISFAVFFCLTIILLLEPKAVVGIVICIITAIVILSIHSILRFRTSTSLETCVQPTFTGVVTWYILAQYCFFATSHQTTLSQIDWRAAFVGRSANFDHSNVLSAILVILNTFCGQIFFTILSGLLCSETFSIYALFPHLKSITGPTNNSSLQQNNSNFSNSNNEKKVDREFSGNVRKTTVNKISKAETGSFVYLANEFDITRGELVLYENESMYFGCLFKLAIQLFMLQGIKVFCSMMACTIHCRHLMVWKIFAPRFIYEAISTLVTLPAAIIGYLILLRIHFSVHRLINQINKTK